MPPGGFTPPRAPPRARLHQPTPLFGPSFALCWLAYFSSGQLSSLSRPPAVHHIDIDYVIDIGPHNPLISRTSYLDLESTLLTRSRVPVAHRLSWPPTCSQSDSDSSDANSIDSNSGLLSVFPTPPPRALLKTHHSGMNTTNNTLRFPIPRTYDPVAKSYQTESVAIDSLKVPQLRELCLRFKKKPSGLNKEPMQEWLRGFSAHPESWAAQMEAGARNTHRNPRSKTTKSTSKKMSSRRREDLLAKKSESGDVVPRRPTERSRDERTGAEIASMLPWAAEICRKFPYRPKAERHPASGKENAQVPPGREPVSLQGHFHQTSDMLSAILGRLTHGGLVGPLGANPLTSDQMIGKANDNFDLMAGVDDPFSTTVSLPTAFTARGCTSLLTTTASRSLTSCQSVSAGTSSLPASSSTSGEKTSSFSPTASATSVQDVGRNETSYSLVLVGDYKSPTVVPDHRGLLYHPPPSFVPRIQLTFRRSEISDPPVLSFAGEGPQRLNELVIIWTDEPGSPWHTHPRAVVLRAGLPKIQNVPIPIKYWPSIYRYLTHEHAKIWEKTKARWSELNVSADLLALVPTDSRHQFIIQSWEHSPDDEAFWAAYPSPKGTGVQTVTQVGQSLRMARITRDAQDAADARGRYSGRLPDSFCRRGSSQTLSKDDAIASRFREEIVQKAKAEYGVAFDDIFSYMGRRGKTRMTEPADIADKYKTLKSLPVPVYAL
ncbi:hypothetical protein K438DRAFT_1965421 [Mycena galopus ATCC 62051]|nr:hypothetical protein K438DRAFT_1965421 [Mycena galopus ATCC 62051]